MALAQSFGVLQDLVTENHTDLTWEEAHYFSCHPYSTIQLNLTYSIHKTEPECKVSGIHRLEGIMQL